MSRLQEQVQPYLDDPAKTLGLALALAALALAAVYRSRVVFYGKFILKSLRRNPLRTTLTSLATAVLVFVVTMVWTVLYFLDLVTAEKTQDLKAIVTERWQIPSQMPFAYAADLAEGGSRKKGDVKPQDSMTWQFFGGTLDPAKRTRENLVFFFGMDPKKLLTVKRDAAGNPLRDKDGKVVFTTMMDGVDEFSEAELLRLDKACDVMSRDKQKVIMGRERLEALNKRVGERFKVTSFNYVGIEVEVEVIGQFPEGRYNQSALINRDYINDALDAYKLKNKVEHPMARKSLNLVWLKVPDTEAFRQVADQISTSPKFRDPAVKAETASSGISSFLDAYRDLLWGMRWLLVPAILVTMSLVIANAISISVRERRAEMAVLKVLGFGPGQVMALVLGEALLIGCGAGLLSAGGAYLLINNVIGGVKFPIAFFPAFKIPAAALWWGPALGGVTALAGSLLPAWSARSVKVSEVFSKVS